MSRRIGQIALALTAISVAAVLLVHAPFVRRAVLRYAVGLVEQQYGVQLEAERLDYNLATMRIGVSRVRLSAVGRQPPFLEATYVAVVVPWRVLLGEVSFEDVAVTDGLVRVRTTAAGISNLPESTPSSGEPAPLRIARLGIAPLRVDIRDEVAGVALDILAWGGQPLTFEWFEAPRADRLQTALDLLRRLGALSDGRLTQLGQQMQRLPLHPRLARMVVAAGGHPDIVRACALLTERVYLPPRHEATASDLLSALDGWTATSPHIRQAAREIARLCQSLPAAGATAPLDERAFRRAVLAGYPDRVARRREAGSPRVKLSSGAGASLSRDSGVLDAEFLVALDVRGSAQADSTIPIASAIESDWLHVFTIRGGKVAAFKEFSDTAQFAEAFRG